MLSTAYSGTKVALDVVKENAGAFPPLIAVVGGLSALLKHYDVSFPWNLRGFQWLIASGL